MVDFALNYQNSRDERDEMIQICSTVKLREYRSLGYKAVGQKRYWTKELPD